MSTRLKAEWYIEDCGCKQVETERQAWEDRQAGCKKEEGAIRMRIDSAFFYGAGGRSRTVTESPPQDFESCVNGI